jgi:TolA-binding protein
MVIYLLDVKTVDTTPKIMIHKGQQPEPQSGKQMNMDIFQGLSGLFAGTEYEGLGNIAPLAKFIDDKHVISRLREKADEQTRKIEELERKNNDWQQKYETLNGNFERLQDDTSDMEDELSEYRNRDKKQDKWVSVLGAAGASIAKNFIRQNPNILSGIIPADQLAGILSDDEQPHPAEPQNSLTDDEQNRLDDATTVFDWLQTLDETTFEKVISVISILRQNTDYANHILTFLRQSSQTSSLSPIKK